MLDLLFIIPLKDIKVKGIQYVQKTIANQLELSDEEENQLVDFWVYFRRFWLRKDIIDVWNINDK